MEASLGASWGAQEHNWGARALFLEPPVADSVTYLRTGARRGSQHWGCEWLSEPPFQTAQACGLWGPLPGQRLPGWWGTGSPIGSTWASLCPLLHRGCTYTAHFSQTCFSNLWFTEVSRLRLSQMHRREMGDHAAAAQCHLSVRGQPALPAPQGSRVSQEHKARRDFPFVGWGSWRGPVPELAPLLPPGTRPQRCWRGGQSVLSCVGRLRPSSLRLPQSVACGLLSRKH